MSERELSLYWKGPWEIARDHVTDDIPEGESLFMVLTGRKETILRRWALLEQVIHVGHSANLRKFLREEAPWTDWEKHNQESLLVKAAVLDPGMNRQDLQHCLVQEIKPPTNLAVVETPNYDDMLVIYNKGKKWPLKDFYRHFMPFPEKEKKPEAG